MGRADSDEYYVIDLCDEVLAVPALRQHKFPWLRGDYSAKKGTHSHLPVDAYWEHLRLVIEYAERQHTETVPIFDRRDTVSGVTRGGQRRLYDQRRAELIPLNGLRLVTIPAAAFQLRRHKIVRDRERDIIIVRGLLAAAGVG